MRNTGFFFFFLFTVSAFLPACGDGFQSSYTKKIDSLNQVLSEIEIQFVALDAEAVKAAFETVTKNSHFMQYDYRDTIDKKTAFFLADYRLTRKSLSQLKNSMEEQEKQITYTRNQVFTLREDLKNNALEKNLFLQYYEAELKAIQSVQESVENMLIWKTSAMDSFHSQNPKVEALVNQHK